MSGKIAAGSSPSNSFNSTCACEHNRTPLARNAKFMLMIKNIISRDHLVHCDEYNLQSLKVRLEHTSIQSVAFIGF